MISFRRYKMARLLLVVVSVVVCAVVVGSRADMAEDQVGHQGQNRPREGQNAKGKDPESIKEKGRMLFGRIRQISRTMMSMKHAEWKEANLSPEEMERKEKALKTDFKHVAQEAEYEIKQRIVDAISGDETPYDPDVPELSREITNLFMEALFAKTFEEQTRKEGMISQILRRLIDTI